MAKYYAVKEGRKTGIYLTWDECKEQVMGYSNAVYKSFNNEEDAKAFINNNTKKVNNDCSLLAYVDGSYNIKTKEYGYGCIILQGQEVIAEFYDKGNKENYASMRNVAGEILGSLAAIKYACEHNYPSICIYYDYEGIEKWADGLWKANKEATKQYVEKIKEYRKTMEIYFQKVLAHSGDYYNERVDKLAKKSVGIK